MAEAPVSIRLEKYIPDKCRGCETAFSVCLRMSSRVLNEAATIEEVGSMVTQNVEKNCPNGQTSGIKGWASSSKKCGYSEKAST